MDKFLTLTKDGSMKKVVLLFLMVFAINCGGGSGSGSSGVSTDFSGLYTYRDDDCEGVSAVNSFTVTHNTSTEAISLQFNTGDTFTGSAYVSDGADGFEVDGIACLFTFISNADDGAVVESISSVNYAIGDLGLLCDDFSDDGICVAIYH